MSGAVPPAIVATGIERRFRRTRALAGVDLEVTAGATLALFGPNGAGKTTLLRILAQVLRPSAGAVSVFGVPAAADPARALASLGFLSHEIALYLDLTPEENLVFTARLYGLDRPQERARAALDEVGLPRQLEAVRALSRGMQQRVALARALLHRPRLVLLDEPWTGLDPQAQGILRERLVQHRKAGGTTVFTSHDLGRGLASADRVALLAAGKLVFAAEAKEITLAELERAYARAASGEAAG